MMSMVGNGVDVAVGAARAGVGLAGGGEGGASGAGAAVWPPAIVKDARRAIHVAFILAALFMRQPMFGSWPKFNAAEAESHGNYGRPDMRCG
jgi:hypothetical protein